MISNRPLVLTKAYVSALFWELKIMPITIKKICVPKDIDIKERIRVVNNYIATQSNKAGEAFASLTFDAMAQKWPCRSK